MKLRNRGSTNLENITNMDSKPKATSLKRIRKEPEKIKKKTVSKIKEAIDNNETSEYFSTAKSSKKPATRKNNKVKLESSNPGPGKFIASRLKIIIHHLNQYSS